MLVNFHQCSDMAYYIKLITSDTQLVASAKIPEHDGDISPASFYGQLNVY